MNNFSIKLLRVLLFLIIGSCIFSIGSRVNAVDKVDITLRPRQSISVNKGMETTWGYITDISSSNENVAKVELDTSKKSKFGKGNYYKAKITGVSPGISIIKIQFYKKSPIKCAYKKTTVVYIVNVKGIPTGKPFSNGITKMLSTDISKTKVALIVNGSVDLEKNGLKLIKQVENRYIFKCTMKLQVTKNDIKRCVTKKGWAILNKDINRGAITIKAKEEVHITKEFANGLVNVSYTPKLYAKTQYVFFK